MRTKVTLVLIFLNVALFFFIFKFERNWRTEAESTEKRRRVLGAEAADIRALEVTNASNPAASFSLQRNRDTWFLTKPLDWPANPHAASAMVLALQLLDHESAFAVDDLSKNKLSLADYGLDKPKLTVAFSSSDPAVSGGARPTTELKIGDTTKDGKRLYLLSPDGKRIHIVNRSLIDSLSIPPEQLRADSLLSIKVFEARSLSVIQSATTEARSGVPPRVRIRFDGTRWIFESPNTARGSKTAVELVISQLNALRPKSFPTPAPNPSTTPALRIIIEATNRQETLFIGEPVPPTVPAQPATAPTPTVPAAPATTEYFAQLEGRSAVFTVEIPAQLMDTLRNAQENLREKRFLEFDSAAVTKIELWSPMQPNQPPVTLLRLEPTAGQPANVAPPWQVVQGPQTWPAERAAVLRLLEQLSLLTAKTFKSDAPTSADLEEWGFNRTLRDVTITQAGVTTPMIVRIGTDAARDAHYARVDTPTALGTSIYQISPEIIQDLQLGPLAWRDRVVTEPLPPTARISDVKLTDLETKQVLFEARLNETGEPTSPPRDPKALKDLVTSLRALRARQFVSGSFLEKVTAAGDERPWRFQLDAVVVVPGPGGVDQSTTRTFFLTERLGGNEQYAGSKELNVVFSLEQPVVDSLWSLAYGARDPGPRVEPKR